MSDKQHLPENIQTLLDALTVAGIVVVSILTIYILVWDIPNTIRGHLDRHPAIKQETTK